MPGIRAIAVAVGVLAAALGSGTAAYAFGDNLGLTPVAPAGAVAEPGVPDTSPTSGSSTWSWTSGRAPSPKKAGASAAAPFASLTRSTRTVAVPDCAFGAGQREVETSLLAIGGYGAVGVDGVQSASDCAAIKKFQQRYGIFPANGQATTVTVDVARRIAMSMSPSRQAACGAGAGVTACVDLTLQTMWVVRDGTVVFGPTVVRTGFRGHATPAGIYRVDRRALREWSDPYEVWLPYWQHFHQGMGFHETTTYIHDASLGSHGCVNLLRPDAVRLWDLIGHGTTVRTFGRRAGT
jgi:lipoprotein-anchoring transpeptidase ErfK/SrfK